MKFLCVSDQIDPLVYSNKIKERFDDVDAVLCAGDLPSEYIDFIVSSLNKPAFFVFGNHNLSEFSYYHKQRSPAGPHFTFAEEHTALDMGGSFGAMYAGFRVLRDRHLLVSGRNGKKRPLLIAGASGSMRYSNGLCQYTDRQMFVRLLMMAPRLLLHKALYGKAVDIFLTHASPRHVHDKEDPCHVGFDCFNWFIRKFQPTYLVHGHIHLYDMGEERVTKVLNTRVVNAYSYHIIEL